MTSDARDPLADVLALLRPEAVSPRSCAPTVDGASRSTAIRV